jgi:hypothetical protein
VTHASAPFHEAQRQVRRAVREASPFLERFARFGFAAKGLTYAIIGLLAALAPVGLTRGPTGTRGVLQTLLRQPVGTVLLAVVALGLLGFGLFQLMRAIEDPEHAGTDGKGIAKRIGWAGNALIHLGLVLLAIGLIAGLRKATGDGDDRSAQDWTAALMSYPFGRWAVAGMGVGILIYGATQVAAGVRGKLDPLLALTDLGDTARRWVRGVSRFGVAARGVVFGLIGVFLLAAAWHANAAEAHGLGGTLRELARQPYGPWLLAVTALGLVAYGVYDFVLARYRRIRV